jgi:LPS-assembly lipoprotein
MTKNATQVLLMLLTVTLCACGFHLRGRSLQSIEFAFKSVYLKTKGDTPFVLELRQSMDLNKITMSDNPEKAEITLEVVSEATDKQILSLSGAGRVVEYQLRYRVSLRAYDNREIDWLPEEEVMLTRILSYDDTQVLAKEQEEILLYRDMRSDAVQQTLRRLSRAKPR